MKHSQQNNAVARQGRGDERVKLHRRAQLVLDSDTEQNPLDVVLEDVSFGGAGMVAATDLPPGTAAVLLLRSAGQAPRSIRGHLLNSKRLENGQFRISMQFDVVTGPMIEHIRYAFFPDDAISE